MLQRKYGSLRDSTDDIRRGGRQRGRQNGCFLKWLLPQEGDLAAQELLPGGEILVSPYEIAHVRLIRHQRDHSLV
jgi:hypothetical protein